MLRMGMPGMSRHGQLLISRSIHGLGVMEAVELDFGNIGKVRT